jgi:2-keto-4-pentenoate hydratase
MNANQIQQLGSLLEQSWDQVRPIPPLSESHRLTLEDAYKVQQAFNDLRLQRGDRVIGRKIGLTSKAVQSQLGVDQPDFGNLWQSRYFANFGGRVEVDAATFLQPRVEGELAFLIGRPLRGPHVTPQEVLSASEAVAYAIEIVDSRIENWRIKIQDTIADNASYGGFVLGSWQKGLLEKDLRTLGMVLSKNGQLVAQGTGAACLDHPARAVAWLANKLSEFGIALEPGDIVMSGSWIPVQAAAKGDVFVLEAYGCQPLSLRFA